jgi:hypothetical protein
MSFGRLLAAPPRDWRRCVTGVTTPWASQAGRSRFESDRRLHYLDGVGALVTREYHPKGLVERSHAAANRFGAQPPAVEFGGHRQARVAGLLLHVTSGSPRAGAAGSRRCRRSRGEVQQTSAVNHPRHRALHVLLGQPRPCLPLPPSGTPTASSTVTERPFLPLDEVPAQDGHQHGRHLGIPRNRRRCGRRPL